MSETLSLAFAFAWLFAVPAHSQEVAPDTLVRTISEEVIGEIRRDKALQAGDSSKIAALVEAKIVPHFDFRRITQIAVGPSWRKATPEQQEQLTQEVKSLIRQNGAEPIVVEYDLAKVGTQWKVFDVRIAGISLVATYRSTFADEVRNNGVDGL